MLASYSGLNIFLKVSREIMEKEPRLMETQEHAQGHTSDYWPYQLLQGKCFNPALLGCLA